jgi:hypothetical protein
VCAECGEWIAIGAYIVMTDAGAVHLECTDDDDPEPPGDACTTCWLVHPEGACDR